MACDTLMLIAQLSGLRINVLANQLGCDTDLARGVHRKLANTLTAMIEDQRRIFAAERVLATARGAADEEDAFYDLYHYQTAYYEKWLVEIVILLNDYLVDDSRASISTSARRAGISATVSSPSSCRWRPRSCAASSALSPTGARFCVDQVYYSEEEAEAAWWESTGHDPETFFAANDTGLA